MTPATPWHRYRTGPRGDWAVAAADGRTVAVVHAAEGEPVAALVAAAPALADAARAALSVVDAAVEIMEPGAPYRAELLAVTLELIAALDDAGLAPAPGTPT